MLRMLSLCSGIGGADLAAQWTGKIEIVGQIENDPFCQAVLSKPWPYVKRLNDIKEVVGDEFGAIDLMVGGIPCQPFSSAGKQHGANDDRYLWPDMFRIVKATKPTWVLIENVDDFAYMALDTVQADLESEDYAVQAFVLPACAIGAPHERQRCFVVAYATSSRLEKQQSAGGPYAESDPSGTLMADTNWLGESRQKSTVSNGQRGTPESAGICRWEDTESVAYAQSTEQQRRRITWAGRDGFTNSCPDVAYADHQRCEELDVTTITAGAGQHGRNVETFRPSGEPESQLGRVLDGIPAWLDRYCWPSLPGQEQYTWEPTRTVTGKQPYRNKRLKALGNAIVPQQIYPLFAAIVAMEESFYE